MPASKNQMSFGLLHNYIIFNDLFYEFTTKYQRNSRTFIKCENLTNEIKCKNSVKLSHVALLRSTDNENNN